MYTPRPIFVPLGLPGLPPPRPAPLPADKHIKLLAAARAAREFFLRGAPRHRDGPHAAACAARAREARARRAYEGLEGASVVDVPTLLKLDVPTLLKRYVALFCGKSVCVRDVLPVLPALSDEGPTRLRTFFGVLPVDGRSVMALKVARLAELPQKKRPATSHR
ncbi:hypothetical protein AURDEDRAFT_178116 [Auricularia subglabra TFB-10046 SS5]|uniref:Uncharacterized protein n=1 Tax=Auricularia subglabra (strain TFB-10046 / SS5) TaxID=717982 RepID=J0D2D9_AURST|nr:hypothetical protein AURDEDRAFT_178116 [Auricularia subglabra TFB-10046 SS5]